MILGRKNKNKDSNSSEDFLGNFLTPFENIFDFNFPEFNEKEIQRKLEEDGHVYYGYQTIIGSNGIPQTKFWGNVNPPSGFKLNGSNINKTTLNSLKEEPYADIIDEDDHFLIQVEIPGVSKKNIKLNASSNALDVTTVGDGRQYSKHIELDFGIDPKSITANYNNGILDVKIKKTEKPKNEGFDVKIN